MRLQVHSHRFRTAYLTVHDPSLSQQQHRLPLKPSVREGEGVSAVADDFYAYARRSPVRTGQAPVPAALAVGERRQEHVVVGGDEQAVAIASLPWNGCRASQPVLNGRLPILMNVACCTCVE